MTRLCHMPPVRSPHLRQWKPVETSTNTTAIGELCSRQTLPIVSEFGYTSTLNTRTPSTTSGVPTSQATTKQPSPVRDNVHSNTTERGSSALPSSKPVRLSDWERNSRLNLSSEDTDEASPSADTSLTSAKPTGTTEHADAFSAVDAAGETTSSVSQLTSTPANPLAQVDASDQIHQPSRAPITSTSKTLPPGPIITYDRASGTDAPSSRGTTESAPIRLVQDATAATDLGRVADLKVPLADGQIANATVRERAGFLSM